MLSLSKLSSRNSKIEQCFKIIIAYIKLEDIFQITKILKKKKRKKKIQENSRDRKTDCFHFQSLFFEISKLNNASKLYIKLEDTLGFQITETLKKKEKEKEDPTKFERSEKTDRFHFQSFPLEIPKLNNASKLYIKLKDILEFQITDSKLGY